MLEIIYSRNFVRMYRKLDPNLKEEIKLKIHLFKDKKNHESLKVHKLKGVLRNLYAFSINYKVRVCFDFTESNTAYLHSVGNHDDVY
jgi:mRNA-degrading endonuclease YafQ of YafQ-DinJ toxin-antitoxin module